MTLFGCWAALGFTGAAFAAPPPEDEEAEVVSLYNVYEERADQLQAEFTNDDPTCPNYEQAPQLVVPVTDNGTLVGYAFVTPRFCFSRGTNRFQIADQMHFVFDNLVRAAHRSPFERTSEQAIDATYTREALLTAAREVIGEGRLDRLDLLGSDVRYMR